MSVRRNRRAETACLWLVVLCLMGLAGCSEQGEDKQETKKREGVAEKIDLQAKVVSMRFVDKKGNERTVEGTFRDDTVVLINDRQESMEHVKPGDKVVVYGHREGKGQDQKLIATRVIVTRPEGTDWKSQPEEKKEPAGEKPTGSENNPDAAKAG